MQESKRKKEKWLDRVYHGGVGCDRAGQPERFGLLLQGSVGPVVRLIGISNHESQGPIVFSTALVVLVALIALLVPRFGATGAAIAAVLVMATWGLWMRWLTVRLLGIRPRII